MALRSHASLQPRPTPGTDARGDAATAWFLAGTFGFAWLLWGYWVAAMPAGGLQLSPAFLAAAIIGGMAPSLTAIAVSLREGGAAGLRALLAPLLRWRLRVRWYALALLTVPAVSILSSAIQAWLVGPPRLAEPGLMAMALVWPAMAALGEEIGWRGFLLPRLAARFELMPAALAVGLLWGMWHLPADYIGLKGYGTWFWAAFLINGPVLLTAHSIVMAWLWRRTGGSLVIAVAYHASVTASALLVPAAGSEGASGVAAAGIGAALMWGVVAWVAIASRADFSGRAAVRLQAGKKNAGSRRSGK